MLAVGVAASGCIEEAWTGEASVVREGPPPIWPMVDRFRCSTPSSSCALLLQRPSLLQVEAAVVVVACKTQREETAEMSDDWAVEVANAATAGLVAPPPRLVEVAPLAAVAEVAFSSWPLSVFPFSVWRDHHWCDQRRGEIAGRRPGQASPVEALPGRSRRTSRPSRTKLGIGFASKATERQTVRPQAPARRCGT